MQTEQIASDNTAAREYFAAEGLSHSGLKDLAVSPLRYWHLWINPNRPAPRTTPELTFGTALHTAVLEPKQFQKRYAKELRAEDYPGCLRTMDDLREWLKSKGLPSSGKNKRELMERVIANSDAETVIFDVLEEVHSIENEGKIVLSQYDWNRALRAAAALQDEPKLKPILAEGKAEVDMFVAEPETGILLKAKMDWITPQYTLDIKTFCAPRGKSIDKAVTSAIYYEGYYRQAYFYSLIRALKAGLDPLTGPQKGPEFINAFVESEEPHEVRLRSIRPKSAGEVNLYWEDSRLQCRDLIRLYAHFKKHFGEKPWRTSRTIDPLADSEMPQIAYA